MFWPVIIFFLVIPLGVAPLMAFAMGIPLDERYLAGVGMPLIVTWLYAARLRIDVDREVLKFRTLGGTKLIPIPQITGLTYVASSRLFGVGHVETRDGRTFTFDIIGRSNSPAVQHVLTRVEAVTGRRWSGRTTEKATFRRFRGALLRSANLRSNG